MSSSEAQLRAPAVRSRERSGLSSLAPWVSGGRLYLVLVGAAVLLGALSLLIPSTPSYDPWAWLVWGREVAHLNLHTTGGPTWKPLTVIFTTIFSLFGSAQPDLWLVVARAGALLALAMTFKIAWRITREVLAPTDPGSDMRRLAVLGPALLAGVLAAGSLINSKGFISNNALGYSEGLMTALVLIAVERHLDGARRQAFAVGFLAALDRPELWVLWGPYGIYLWWRDPGARRLVLALFALIPLLWFAPEYWGSGHFFRGVNRAHHPRSNSAAFASCPFCAELKDHAWPLVLTRIKAIAILGAALAAGLLFRTRKRWWPARGAALEPRTLGLVGLVLCAAVGFGWWVGVAAETQAGFSGNDRYLVLGSALVSIAGGVAWAWLAGELARLLSRRDRIARASPLVGLAVALALFLAVPPWIGRNVIDLQRTHRALVYQSHLREDARTAVARLGGSAAVRRCGSVMTEGFQVPMLAWTLGVHTLDVQASPILAPGQLPPPAPNVVFQTRAQSNDHLLPLLRTWPSVHYHLVTSVRTFRVFEHCG